MKSEILWAVTAIEHPGLRDVSRDCESCLALAETAIAYARATGARGVTHRDENAAPNKAAHSVTVARALKVVSA